MCWTAQRDDHVGQGGQRSVGIVGDRHRARAAAMAVERRDRLLGRTRGGDADRHDLLARGHGEVGGGELGHGVDPAAGQRGGGGQRGEAGGLVEDVGEEAVRVHASILAKLATGA
jgi:hypothetical protein